MGKKVSILFGTSRRRRKKTWIDVLCGPPKRKRNKWGYGATNGFDYETMKGFHDLGIPQTLNKIFR